MLANRSQTGVAVMQARAPALADDLPACLGDLLDDRIAEVLDEALDERAARLRRGHLSPAFAALGFLIALVASFLLRHSAVAVSTVWPSMAAVCLAARAARADRT